MKPMRTQDVVDLVHERGDLDAYALATEHLPGVERRFHRLEKQLKKLMDEIRVTFPDATYYTASGGLHILIGASHKGAGSAIHETLAFDARSGIVISDGDY